MRLTIAALALALTALPAGAATLPAPTGPVILTISGDIENSNTKDGSVQMDQAMLDALPGRTTVTATPWFDGKMSFSGPLMSEVLKFVGAKGVGVKFVAIDDYASDIPAKDFADSPVILADLLNGKPMSVRDKGPLFVIYPFDIRPDLYNEAVFGKSVWQVKALDVH